MVDNGYIAFVTATSSGFDGNNNPIAPTTSLSEPVPCNISRSKNQLNWEVDGQVREVKYVVTISKYHISPVMDEVHSIQLYDAEGEKTYEMQVIHVELMPFTKSYKILL